MKKIYIISGIICFFFGIFDIVFIEILPLAGIYFDYNIKGHSMEPRLTNDVDIRLSPTRVPYEDLQVGDVILFKQWDYEDNNMPPGIEYVPEWNKDHSKLRLVRQTELEEEQKKYSLVRHRIIEINEKGLVTKGDNNEDPDIFPVKPEEYQGKILWHLNHINWLFKVMYQYGIWLGCSILFIDMSFFPWGKKKTDSGKRLFFWHEKTVT